MTWEPIALTLKPSTLNVRVFLTHAWGGSAGFDPVNDDGTRTSRRSKDESKGHTVEQSFFSGLTPVIFWKAKSDLLERSSNCVFHWRTATRLRWQGGSKQVQVLVGTRINILSTPCRAVKAGECYMVRGDFCQDAQVDPMIGPVASSRCSH